MKPDALKMQVLGINCCVLKSKSLDGSIGAQLMNQLWKSGDYNYRKKDLRKFLQVFETWSQHIRQLYWGLGGHLYVLNSDTHLWFLCQFIISIISWEKESDSEEVHYGIQTPACCKNVRFEPRNVCKTDQSGWHSLRSASLCSQLHSKIQEVWGSEVPPKRCYSQLSAVPGQPCFLPAPWGSRLCPSPAGSGCGISGPRGSFWEEEGKLLIRKLIHEDSESETRKSFLTLTDTHTHTHPYLPLSLSANTSRKPSPERMYCSLIAPNSSWPAVSKTAHTHTHTERTH